MNKKYVLLAMTAVAATVPVSAFAQPMPDNQRPPEQNRPAPKPDDVRKPPHDNMRHQKPRKVVKVDIRAPHRIDRKGCGWGAKITRYSNGDRISKKAFVCKAPHGRWHLANHR